MHLSVPLATISLAAITSAASLPDNVKKFYDSVRSQGQCNNKLQDGFTLSDSASDTDNSEPPNLFSSNGRELMSCQSLFLLR